MCTGMANVTADDERIGHNIEITEMLVYRYDRRCHTC